MRIAALVALVIVACSSPPKAAPPTTQPVTTNPGADSGGERSLLYPGGDPRFEGPSFKNACGGDGDCKVGGCGGEVCTAEEGVNSVCVAYPDAPKGASCGCVRGECVWYKGAGAAPTGSAEQVGEPQAGAAPGQGKPCADGKCAAGLSCVTYYGIAGPRGPQFTSCEIRCGGMGGGKGCPAGQQCVTIADGPGQVCRQR